MQKIILTTESAKHFGFESGKMEIGRFSGGEVSLSIKENIQGAEVYIVGSTGAPAENLVELILAIDTSNRLQADKITAIIPYFGYSRGDKEKFPGDSVAVSAIARVLESVGGVHFDVKTINVHSPRVKEFFKVPFMDIDVSDLFAGKFKDAGDITVIAPDKGAERKASEFAKSLGITKVAVLEKKRAEDGSVSIIGITGEVGERVLIFDDIIDSGGTLVKASEYLSGKGVKEIYVAAVHMVWSGGGYKKLNALDTIKKIYTTDTVVLPEAIPQKIEVIPVAPVLKKAILS